MILAKHLFKTTLSLLRLLKIDGERLAASLAGLPTCFKYAVTGPHATATPDIEATRLYLEHLRLVWGRR